MNDNQTGIAERQSVAVLSKQVRPKMKHSSPANSAPRRLGKNLPSLSWFGEVRKRKQLSHAARLARTAAALVAGEEYSSEQAASYLDFDASRAEFEELARSAGALIAYKGLELH